jgi:hypothetical protein
MRSSARVQDKTVKIAAAINARKEGNAKRLLPALDKFAPLKEAVCNASLSQQFGSFSRRQRALREGRLVASVAKKRP